MEHIGARIREIRIAQRRSLNDVASRATISTATLSRIETGKQGLDVSLLIRLAKILKVAAAEFLGDQGKNREQRRDELVEQLAGLSVIDRAHLWSQVAATHRQDRTRHDGNIAAELDELIAQVEHIRLQIEAMRGTRERRTRIK